MRHPLTLIVAVIVFALDQASKWWVMEIVDLPTKGFIEVAPFLNFAMAYNTGINFGILASGSATQQYVLAGFAAVVSVVLFVWAERSADKRFAAAAGLVIGGALGNALDRLTVGAVVDFLNVTCCGIRNPYAFNVADTAIFVGALGLALLLWRDTPAESAN